MLAALALSAARRAAIVTSRAASIVFAINAPQHTGRWPALIFPDFASEREWMGILPDIYPWPRPTLEGAPATGDRASRCSSSGRLPITSMWSMASRAA